jgi:hypothetical protein
MITREYVGKIIEGIKKTQRPDGHYDFHGSAAEELDPLVVEQVDVFRDAEALTGFESELVDYFFLWHSDRNLVRMDIVTFNPLQIPLILSIRNFEEYYQEYFIQENELKVEQWLIDFANHPISKELNLDSLCKILEMAGYFGSWLEPFGLDYDYRWVATFLLDSIRKGVYPWDHYKDLDI